MDVMRSARNFVKHVREEGWYSIPPLLYARWMAVKCRPYLKEEARRRGEETEAYQGWLQAQQPDESQMAQQRARRFSHRLSILIPTYNTRPDLLNALVDSLLAQTCESWEACFYDGASPNQGTRDALAAVAERDPRLRVTFGTENLNISGNTNRALDMAQYDYVALLDHDDLLTADAVYCVLAAAEDGADMIYSDEDKCNETGDRFFDPHLKADFAPDTLRSGNYICHLMAMRRSLMEEVGRLRSRCDGSQDHDLALRASEQAERITHIPRILYHWRMLDSSVSHQGAARCVNAAVVAVDDQLKRLKLPGRVYMDELRVRIAYDLPADAAVSLIVTCLDQGAARYLRALRKRTDFPFAEVLTVGGGEALHWGDKPCTIVPDTGSVTDGINEAARRAKGQYIAIIAQGLYPMRKAWVRELLMFAQRPDVGCVGTAILDKNYFYLNAGWAVDVPGGAVSHQAGAFLYGNPYMITDRIVRNVTAVSRLMMMADRDVFLTAGGLGGGYEHSLSDVALGLRLMEAGRLNVFTPYARAVCKAGEGLQLRNAADRNDLLRFLRQRGEHPTERYYSPLFEKKTGAMVLDVDRREETL